MTDCVECKDVVITGAGSGGGSHLRGEPGRVRAWAPGGWSWC